MTSAVFQMAGLAGAGIEQGPEPVGGLGGRGRGDPILAEDGIADLEVELALEIHIAGGVGESVGVVHAPLRGRAAAGPVLSGLEERNRVGDLFRLRRRFTSRTHDCPCQQRQRNAEQDRRGEYSLPR
jgi:hypothetical protein